MDSMPVYSELHTIYPPGQHLVSLIEGRKKLILSNPNTSSSLKLEFYDLDSDENERVNLSYGKRQLVEHMKEEIESFVSSQQDAHTRLVPVVLDLPLSKERMKELEALGYLNK